MKNSPLIPIRVLTALFTALSLHVFAETPQEKAAAALENFFALGLPETRDAKWVTVRPMDSIEIASPIPDRNGYQPNAGNAWLLRENSDGTVDLIINQCEPLHARLVKPANANRRPSDGMVAVIIQPADLDKDITAAEKALGTLTKKKGGDPDDDNDFQENYRLQQTVQQIQQTVLFLAQLRHHDRAEAAGRLLPSVLAATRQPAPLLDAVATALAHGRLRAMLRDWQHGGSAEAYAAGVEAVCRDIHRGWAGREAALLLAKRLREQSPSTRAAAPDPAKMANVILGLKNDALEKMPLYVNWLLPPSSPTSGRMTRYQMMMRRRISPEESDDSEDTNSGAANSGAPDFGALKEFVADKHHAAATMAELLEDHRFVRCDKAARSPNRGSYYSSSNGLPSIESLYSELPRPLELGEFVQSLLEGILANPPEQNGQDSPRLAYEPTVAWLKEAAKLKDEELAWKFLRRAEQTSSPGFQSALPYLIKAGGPETIRRLQEVFMDPAVWAQDQDSMAQALATYLPKLGDQQTAYGAKLEAALKAAFDEELKTELEQYGRSGAGDMKKYLEQNAARKLSSLREVLRPQGVPEILAEMLKGSPEEAGEKMSALTNAMKANPEGVANHIAQAAAKTKDVGLRHTLLFTLSNIGPKGDKLDLATRSALLTLLGDDRELSPMEWGPVQSTSVAVLAAQMVLQRYVTPETRTAWAGPLRAQPKLGEAWSKSLALAVVKGEPLPVAPDTKRVTPERLQAVLAELGAAKPEDTLGRFGALVPDEQLALLEHLQGAPTWPEPLAAAQFTIVKVDGGKKPPFDLAKWKGRRVDAAALDELTGEMEKALLAGQTGSLVISRGGAFDGISLSFAQRGTTQISMDQVDQLKLPGLDPAARPDFVTYTQIITSAKAGGEDDPMQRMRNGAGFAVPLWKKPELTSAWKAAHLKFEPAAKTDAKTEDEAPVPHNPAGYMQRRNAWFQMKPEARGPGTITISAVKIGDKPKGAGLDADGPDSDDEEDKDSEDDDSPKPKSP